MTYPGRRLRSATVPEHNADLVVLGGGSGGYACALRAAELGMSVVLVERDKLGGTCLHSGCIPTKALLHAAEVADSAREGDRIGVKSSLAGIDMAGVIASNEAIRLDEVPSRVVILGGGVIGVEFASVFASFGAQVTIVEALPRLVPGEDEFASKLLERAYRRRKIAFKTGVKFTGAKQTDHGVTVSLESGEELEADYLLVAVGRGPNTAGH